MNVRHPALKLAVGALGAALFLSVAPLGARDSATIPTPHGLVRAQPQPAGGRPPARQVQEPRPAPSGLLQQDRGGRAREMHEAIQLVLAAHQAFDRGDEARGRALAQEAVRRFEAVERAHSARGRAREASRLAEQRGRVNLELLDDEEAAKEAFADAVLTDERNEGAVRALAELLDRQAARAAATDRSRAVGNPTPNN